MLAGLRSAGCAKQEMLKLCFTERHKLISHSNVELGKKIYVIEYFVSKYGRLMFENVSLGLPHQVTMKMRSSIW